MGWLKGILQPIVNRLQEVKCQKIEAVKKDFRPPPIKDHISLTLLFEELNPDPAYIKKIVIVIDEFDGIPRIEMEELPDNLKRLISKA